MMTKYRILIINEFQECGGAEVYVDHVTAILKSHGHDVLHMYLSHHKNDRKGETQEDVWVVPPLGKFEKVIVDPFYTAKLRRQICRMHPDLILLNNAFSSPLSQYRALSGWPVVQVVHDYTPACPKSTCLRDDGTVCMGIGFSYCPQFCTYHGSSLQLRLKYWQTLAVNRLRRHVVQKFISPSKRLAEVLAVHDIPCTVIPHSLTFSESTFSLAVEHLQSPHRYLYLGALNENKGIHELLPAFREFAKGRHIELHLCGSCTDDATRNLVKKYQNENIIYHGSIPHEDVMAYLRNAYVLLVPSKSMESYSLTALEGKASGALVISSDRGGMPEQLSDGRGIVYPFGKEGLMKALDIAEHLSPSSYHQMTKAAMHDVHANYSDERYYERFMTAIASLSSSRKNEAQKAN